jgi:hypothetical protein
VITSGLFSTLNIYNTLLIGEAVLQVEDPVDSSLAFPRG